MQPSQRFRREFRVICDALFAREPPGDRSLALSQVARGLPEQGGRIGIHMTSLWPRLEPLLAKVQKPARYIGGEDGALTPDHGPGKVAWLLVYPDAYEIGLPNQGLQILYEILNERADAVAERAYAPWLDLEALLRRHGLPLFSVDTHRPAGEFDLIAFNLSAELVYTNLLNCLDLAGVPVRAEARGPEHPLIGAGGHCTYNPEPLADFVDFFAIGDGEEVVSEITEVVRSLEEQRSHAGIARARAARARDHSRRLRAVDVRRRLRRRTSGRR